MCTIINRFIRIITFQQVESHFTPQHGSRAWLALKKVLDYKCIIIRDLLYIL